MVAVCRQTPGNLKALAIVLLLVAAGTVVVIPDDSTGLVIAQYTLVAALGSAGVAALLGGSFVGMLQKE